MFRFIDKAITKYLNKRQQKRAFDAGKTTRLTSDWETSRKSADADIKPSLKRMVVNSRSLAQNDDYIKKFLRLLETNVIGPDGIKLQSQVKGSDGKNNKDANDAIEAGWKKWGKKKNAGVDGKHSWNDICRLAIKTIATDGEIILRKVKGFDNPFAFSLQLIEADHLDEELNRKIGGQNEIRMGIEFDQWRRPVAYNLLASHPGDNTFIFHGHRYQRIPAEEIIHIFISDRIGQSRGVPWVHAAMSRLKMLGGYEEAELVGARTGASQMGVIITPDGQYEGDNETEEGKIEMEAEPGLWRSIPRGTDFKQFDPTHPAGNFQPFVKSILRGVSSGIGVSYNSLASDLEGVNFSSIRQGALEERDSWRTIQAWVIDHLISEVFDEWLLMALTTQAVQLPISRYDDLNKPAWRPRGWNWVDPVKDVKAAILAIENGLNSRTRIAAEQGRDLEEIYDELALEKKMGEERDLNLGTKNNLQEKTDESENKDRQALSVVRSR